MKRLLSLVCACLATAANVNDVTELQAPFGGWKQSGFGRELGRAALEACLETKHVRIGLQTTVPSRPSGATAADQPLS